MYKGDRGSMQSWKRIVFFYFMENNVPQNFEVFGVNDTDEKF